MKAHSCLIFAILLITSLIERTRAASFSPFENFLPFPNGVDYGQSNAQANANAFSNYNNPNEFGSSASSALAQSFNSQSPLNSFGASAAHSQNQGFSVNRFGGIDGGANAAISQTYDFGNQKINVAFSNGFSIGADGQPQVSNSHAISFT